MVYGVKTWTFKQHCIDKLQVAQSRTKLPDVGRIMRKKMAMPLHISLITDGRWSRRVLEERPGTVWYRPSGRQKARWAGDTGRVVGNTWMRMVQDRYK